MVSPITNKSELVFGILNDLYARQASRWQSGAIDEHDLETVNNTIADAMNMLEVLYVINNLPSSTQLGFVPYGKEE